MTLAYSIGRFVKINGRTKIMMNRHSPLKTQLAYRHWDPETMKPIPKNKRRKPKVRKNKIRFKEQYR